MMSPSTAMYRAAPARAPDGRSVSLVDRVQSTVTAPNWSLPTAWSPAGSACARMTSGAAPIAQVRPSSRWMPMLKMMVPLRAGSPFQEVPNHCPRRVMYLTVTSTGRSGWRHSIIFLNRRRPSW